MKFKKEQYYNIALVNLGIKKTIFNGDLSVLTEEELSKMNVELDVYLIQQEKNKLNTDRNKELQSFVISNIFFNQKILNDMVIVYAVTSEEEKITWIDEDNKAVVFTKEEVGALIKEVTKKVEVVYFKYRGLKDNIKENK